MKLHIFSKTFPTTSKPINDGLLVPFDPTRHSGVTTSTRILENDPRGKASAVSLAILNRERVGDAAMSPLQSCMNAEHRSPAALVHAFYEARQANDPDALRQWLANDVRWNEPVVGDHMGHLQGADAVVDMLKHALATTGGTFSLRVANTVETGSHCAAVIEWSADKNGRTIRGQEMAIFGFKRGQITEAAFFASDISNDQAFWEG